MELGQQSFYLGCDIRCCRYPSVLIKRALPLVLLFVLTIFFWRSKPLAAESPLSPKRQLALDHYHEAIQLRTSLESKPKRLRTAPEYLKVINNFKAVFYVSPASSKADDALKAIAEIYQLKASDLGDPRSYLQAIRTYEFLVKEYPDSPYCSEALFASAEIHLNDLNDPKAAQEFFRLLLSKFPGSEKARKARARLDDFELRQTKKVVPRETKPSVYGAPRDPQRNASPPAAAATRVELVTSLEVNKALRAENPKKVENSSNLAALKEKEKPVGVKNVRFWNSDLFTRVIIDVDGKAKFVQGTLEKPARIFLDIQNARLAFSLMGSSFSLRSGYPRQIRVGQLNGNVARVVLDVSEVSKYHTFTLDNPFRIFLDVQPPVKDKDALLSLSFPQREWRQTRGEPLMDESDLPSSFPVATALGTKQELSSLTRSDAMASSTTTANSLRKEPGMEIPLGHLETAKSAKTPNSQKEEGSMVVSRVARPKSDGTRSLIRTLGLKIGRIVIDPGHGGDDTGTVGPSGLQEKDLVLDVSLKLKKLIEEKLGGEVILTRQDDTFIPLETRTAIANESQADLFLSIHANSSRSRKVSGIETFFLNFATSPDVEEVAARENASAQKTIFELQDLVQKIALKEKTDESKEFAQTMQRAITTYLQKAHSKAVDRGVKQAPFIVLIGANMPSILSEISFVSNPSEEKLLKSSSYRHKVAEALCQGIKDYISNLSGIKTAKNVDR